MNGILEWEVFAYKFRGNPQVAFETLAYHMFCRKYHITEGLPAFYNQKHIETDPYTCDDGTVVGFQAKYYSTPSITAAQKSELIKDIEGAKATYDGINMLCFYLSRPFPQKPARGKTKTEMQKEIESKANELGITIEWIVPSNFEKILNEPENADLRGYFFSVGSSGETPRVLPKCLTIYLPLGPEIGLVGRDDIVDELRTMLDKEKCIALVRGLGGIGKTAVMQKVCDKILNDGDGRNHVAWITCGDSLKEDLLVLSDAFGISKDIGREEAYKAVLGKMKEIEGRLYLFLDDLSRDSVKKDLKTLNALRPNVHVMITSRRQIKGIPHLELHELNDGSAIDMFYGYYERDKERKYLADAIGIIDSESVKRHTLLVELLAKAANRSFDTLDVFRGELEKKGFFEVSKAKLDGAHDENLTIEESVIKLYGISGLTPEQRRIMSLFSIFTPEKVIYGKVVEWAGFDENDVEDLVQLGWLVRTEGGYVIHQIVKDSIARQVGDSLKIEEYGELLEKVADTDSYLSVKLGYTKVRERLVLAEDMARHLNGRMDGMISTSEYSEGDVAFLQCSMKLLHNIGGLYCVQGEYTKAIESYKKTLSIRKQVQETDHLDTAIIYNKMGDVYRLLGEYEKALDYCGKALFIFERVLGKDHPETATLYNNMALVFNAQGKYEKALKYYRKDLAIIERVLGKDHPETATVYNNMALVLSMQGEYEKALGYYGKALSIREQVLGSDHPNTAMTYSNIALVFNAQGEYKKAQEYNWKALTVRERVLGKNHPDTATSYNNICVVYLNRGEYEKALEYNWKALSIRERVLGKYHPDTAMTYNNMGSAYYGQAKYEKALEYYMKALVIFEQVLGKDHPDIAMTYNNIACAYSKQRKYMKTLPYFRKALSIRERVLGKDHPDTALMYNNMAGVYKEQGEYEKALEYYEKALTVFMAKLGANHPYTQNTQESVAIMRLCLMTGLNEDQLIEMLQNIPPESPS